MPNSSRSYTSTTRLAFGRVVATSTIALPEPDRCASWGSRGEIVQTPSVSVVSVAEPEPSSV
jgi:hypothetical protein